MALPSTPDNAGVNSYTNGAWTTLTAVAGIYQTLILANNGANSVACEARLALTAGPANICQFLPARVLAPGAEPVVMDISSIVVKAGQEIQLRFDAAGMQALISGATY